MGTTRINNHSWNTYVHGGLSGDNTFSPLLTADKLTVTNYVSAAQGLSAGDIFTSGKVGIGTSKPMTVLHVKEDVATGGSSTGVTIENDGSGDAILQYLLTGVRRWVTGIDHSDSDKFKFASSGNLGSNEALSLDTDGNVAATGTITSTSSVSRPVQSNENNTTPIRAIERLSQSDYTGLVDAGTVNANTLYIIE